MASQGVFDAPTGGLGSLALTQAKAALSPALESTAPPPRSGRLHVIGRLLHDLPRPAWLIVDTVIIWIATVQSFRWFDVADFAHHAESWLTFSVYALCLTVGSLIFGLNERTTLTSRGRILTRMLLTVTLSCILAYAIIYVLMYLRLSRRVVAATLITYYVCGSSLRLLASSAIHAVRRRLLVVGRPAACAAFTRRLKENFGPGHEIIGFVHSADDAGELPLGMAPPLGTTHDIVALCRAHHIRDIVVCNGIARDPSAMDWMLPCLRLGCRVTNEATFYETSVGRILVDEITPEWFLFTDLKAHCEQYAMLKRAFDVVVSIVGVAVSLPFYPLIALAIKLEDGGPVFYSQDRVGRNGAVFKLWKFRTMQPDAERGESRWASRNDPRITYVGRFLRHTRLDEFPQFFNILWGAMSVVGPRPERPDIDASLCTLAPYWSERHLVKPGLTGWAQISFRYGNTVEDAKRKLQYDFYYLKHMSLELDIIVVFRTLGTFLRGAC
ncbi:MAG TPA: sugar transferase [Phycisphaerae bacterium]|nr:sugar transferase [Phycisphaerales bacterium]HRX86361.1 sugar transferase [Phycisphaerae bacterium]